MKLSMISEKGQEVLAFAITLGITALMYCVILAFSMPNRVTNADAEARFSELAQVPQDKIQLIRNTNNTLPFGDLHDVTYELLIEGKSVSGRCTSGWMGTSPLICRLYWGTGSTE